MSDNFHVAPADIIGRNFVVRSPEEIRHITRVLRYRPGDMIDIFDGKGRRFKAAITSIEIGKIAGQIVEEYAENNEAKTAVTLACALLKKEKFDWLIEKAVELGVQEIIPLVTARTIVRPQDDRAAHKVERWQKNVVAACQQSKRSCLPAVWEPVGLPQLLNQIPKYDLVIVPALEEKEVLIGDLPIKGDWPHSILLVIGPEGGLTDEEIAQAKIKGAHGVSLGKRRLRSETAAIVGLANILAWRHEI
jgi:16S rRNA (uracil1498-N3)-methyltransferase